jgi:predicted metal-dependent peptidase
MRRSTQPKLSVFETARAGIVKTQAMMFFASALLQTRYVIDETCDTAWTDMVVIGYNPSFIEKLSVAVAKFVILHELLHILLKHGLRRGSRDPAEWNICCDYAINVILRDMGVAIWEHALIDERYRGMSAEQIYAARQQERSKSRGKSQGKSLGQGNGQSQPQPGDQGGLGGDLRQVAAVTPEQVAAIEHEISKTVARATTIAKQYGVMPGALEAIVGATYEDPVPWEQVLIDYMSAVVKQRENWSRRNRRYSDVILPSCWSNGMDELTIVADSSGSMFSKPVFERVAVAVNHIVTIIKPMTVRVIWSDDKDCQNIDVFEDGAEVILHPKGGGGTDMRKPLVYAEQYRPEVVLLLTDGYTPWPDVATPFPLIVGCTTDAPCPDWAGVVRIEVQ